MSILDATLGLPSVVLREFLGHSRVFGASLGILGASLECPCGILGRSFGTFGGSLGRPSGVLFWASLGLSLSVLGAYFGRP